MKRFAAAFLVSVLSLGVLAGCGGAKTAAPADNKAAAAPAADAKKNTVLKIGATAVPHAEILAFAKPLLAKEGIDLQIVTFTDYVQPNTALNDKQLDANYFQHVPYLTQFNADHKMDLVSAGGVHLEPMGLYSVKVSAVKEIKDGATITIPNDPSNGGRALNLLAQQGLIKLKDGVGVKATVKDITENPHKLKITEVAAEQLPRSLQDVDASVINTNYYLDAQKNLGVKANTLAKESADNNPYVNIITVRKGDENRPEIQKLLAVLHSADVVKFINDKYQGAVIPAK